MFAEAKVGNLVIHIDNACVVVQRFNNLLSCTEHTDLVLLEWKAYVLAKTAKKVSGY